MHSHFISSQTLPIPWKLLETFDYLVLPSCGPRVSLLQGTTCFPFLTIAEGSQIMIFNSFCIYIDLKFQLKQKCFLVAELVRKKYLVCLEIKNRGEGQENLGQCSLSPGILVFSTQKVKSQLNQYADHIHSNPSSRLANVLIGSPARRTRVPGV